MKETNTTQTEQSKMKFYVTKTSMTNATYQSGCVVTADNAFDAIVKAQATLWAMPFVKVFYDVVKW